MGDSEARIDESSIPLLDEVVDPQDLSGLGSTPDGTEYQAKKQKTLLEILRENIIAQLNHDLSPVIATAVAHTVDRMTEQTREMLQEELNRALQEHLQILIDAQVAKEMAKSGLEPKQG
jgi:hypothetical protein